MTETMFTQDRQRQEEEADLEILMLEQQIFEHFLSRAEQGQCIREDGGKDADGNRITDYYVPILPEDIERFPLLLKKADTYLLRDIDGIRTEGMILQIFKEGYEELV